MISLYAIDRQADGLISACLDAFDRSATDAERNRAARFRLPSDQLSHRLGRGALRLALAQETGLSPDTFRFETAPSGKPFLPGGPFFNLSHSGDRILIAISQGFDLGLDIELLAAATAPLSAAVADEDRKLLPDLSDNPAHAETILWSIKEAALKLTGEVMVDPRHLSVRRQRGGGFRIFPARAAKAPLPDIFVHLVVMGDGYVAALATYEPTVTAKAALVWKNWLEPLSCALPAGQGSHPAPQTVSRDSSLSARMWPLCPTPSAA